MPRLSNATRATWIVTCATACIAACATAWIVACATAWIVACVTLLVCVSPAAAQTPAFGDKPAVTTPKPAAKSSTASRARATPAVLAGEAKGYEDAGAYARAAATLQELRRQNPTDLDLDIALALDQARAGDHAAAWELVTSPRAEAALDDSMPETRRRDYPWGRDALWINGAFDGWHWYIVRARAELAAAAGRWREARAAARASVAARPLAGKEWLILAICAAHDGDLDAARSAAKSAVDLDPTLPEAHYLQGVLAWREGRRAEAQERFRAAVGLDSAYAAAASALVRSRLPIGRPDSLPRVFLTGARAAGLLTSPTGPKIEEFVQMDKPAIIARPIYAEIPEALRRGLPPVQLTLPILVDERGRLVMHELPWFEPSRLPPAVLSVLLSSLPQWRFHPALRHNEPRAVWTAIPLNLQTGP